MLFMRVNPSCVFVPVISTRLLRSLQPLAHPQAIFPRQRQFQQLDMILQKNVGHNQSEINPNQKKKKKRVNITRVKLVHIDLLSH